ncbi:MAG: SurA N-terminal domain-containing protein [Endomicrobia bacterium]|nr:SurA N-terminal domain-containing protein [Endomicrobiia bacterium]
MLKKLFAALIVSAFMTGVAVNPALAAGSDIADQTLAVVNGEPIFSSDFNAAFMPMLDQFKQTVPQDQQTEAKVNELKTAVLNQKIEETLLKQEAKKQKIKVSKKEVQDAVDQIKKRFANESEFTAELKKENLSRAEFEKKLEEQLAVMKLVRQSIDSKVKAPTESDVKAFYDKVQTKMKGGETGLSKEDDDLATNLANFMKRMSGEQVRLRQIFVSSPKGAASEQAKASQARVEIVKKELAKGTDDFATLAGKFSEDPASKDKGGDIGIVVKGDLPAEIDKVVFGMHVGEITKEPVKTERGFHFLRVEEKRASRTFTFDEVKNDIGQLLYQNESKKAYSAWINDLKSKANVKINKTW